jgi:hypothetical protein
VVGCDDALIVSQRAEKRTPHPPDSRLLSSSQGPHRRAWLPCQDRLVSELRLAQAITLAQKQLILSLARGKYQGFNEPQANPVLARFCADYNPRFAPPRRRRQARLPLPAPALRSRPLPRLKRRYRPDSIAWVQHGNRRCTCRSVSCRTRGFAYAQPPGRCIPNHFRPLELFLIIVTILTG